MCEEYISYQINISTYYGRITNYACEVFSAECGNAPDKDTIKSLLIQNKRDAFKWGSD